MRKMTNFLKTLLATGFYLGYMPTAPATFACAISIAIWYFLLPYKSLYIILSINLFIWGLLISDHFSKQWGKDPKQIVIDEYACLLFPLFFTSKRILPLVITFVLFRLFDILKPPPLRKLEKLPGGWGIMLDDLGAAVYTAIVVLALHLLGVKL